MLEVLNVQRNKEVRSAGELFTSPYVPPASITLWMVSQSVEWQQSGSDVLRYTHLQMMRGSDKRSAVLLAHFKLRSSLRVNHAPIIRWEGGEARS